MGLYERWAKPPDLNVEGIGIPYMFSAFREVIRGPDMTVSRVKSILQMTAEESAELDNMIDYWQSLDAVNQENYVDRWLLDVELMAEMLDLTNLDPVTGIPRNVYDRPTVAAALGLDFGVAGGTSVQMSSQYVTASQKAKWIALSPILKPFIQHILDANP